MRTAGAVTAAQRSRPCGPKRASSGLSQHLARLRTAQPGQLGRRKPSTLSWLRGAVADSALAPTRRRACRRAQQPMHAWEAWPKWSEPCRSAGSGARLRLPGVPVQQRERVRRARAQPQRQLLRREAVHGHAQRRVHRRRRRRGLRASEKLSVHAVYGMSSPLFEKVLLAGSCTRRDQPGSCAAMPHMPHTLSVTGRKPG